MDELLHGLGRLALILLVLVVAAAVVPAILAQFRLGLFFAPLLAPAAAAGVTYWFAGHLYWVVMWVPFGFILGAFAFMEVPTHRTKSGAADRRYKDNPDASGITGEQRATALLGLLGVVLVIVAAWVFHLPGSTIKL
jgi:hypothetical protein